MGKEISKCANCGREMFYDNGCSTGGAGWYHVEKLLGQHSHLDCFTDGRRGWAGTETMEEIDEEDAADLKEWRAFHKMDEKVPSE